MKTKVIVATLLVAAAASADARFAPPYPRKPLAPDESGHWIAMNGDPWSRDAEPEPEQRKIIAKQGKNTPRRGTISLGDRVRESWERFHVL